MEFTDDRVDNVIRSIYTQRNGRISIDEILETEDNQEWFSNTLIEEEKMFDIVKELNNVRLVAPIKCRDVVIENVCGTGVNIIATRTIEK